MKNSTCLIAALILGLLIAWNVAMPTSNDGVDKIGGCKKCMTEGEKACPKIDPQQDCSETYTDCDKATHGKDCWWINMACFETNCARHGSYSCI